MEQTMGYVHVYCSLHKHKASNINVRDDDDDKCSRTRTYLDRIDEAPSELLSAI